jgi:hypothetical protein
VTLRAPGSGLAAAAVVLGVLACAREARAQVTRFEAPPTGLVHEAVVSARRGAAIVISVGVQNELAFDSLVLAYRPEGTSEFRYRDMRLASEGSYRAEIPYDATLGHTVAYYIEARDREGAPVAGRASAESPLVIKLTGEPPWRTTAPPPSDEEDESDDQAGRRFFVALLAGTGAGWATGNGDTNADTMLHP